MKLRTLRFAFALWVFSGAMTCLAQGKRACDLLSKTDLESATGVMLYTDVPGMATNTAQRCGYTNQEPGKPIPSRPVGFIVTLRYSGTPDPTAVEDMVRQLKQVFRRDDVAEVTGLGDAAVWYGNEQAATLFIFRGGTETMGLEGSVGLDKLKALALKAMGGTGKTGYTYGAARPPQPVVTEQLPVGGTTLSQAAYLTQSQFLKELKEVSLTITAPPSLARYVSPPEQRNYVTTALTSYGISVRPNAPVSLLVTFDELESTFRKTTIYTRGANTSEDFHVHNFYVSFEFFVRAAVRRNGKLHLVKAAPARSWYENEFIEDGDIRKLLMGDETSGDIKSTVKLLVVSCLKSIAQSSVEDSVAWYGSSWTGTEKAAADAEFARLMNPGQAPEKRQIEGIDGTPQLQLETNTPDDPGDGCPVDPSWRRFWNAEFQRLNWIKAQAPDLTLRHYFYCEHMGVLRFGPGYFRIFDDLALRESNAVFELNGRVFRKPTTLLGAHRMLTSLGDSLPGVLQGFLPRSITEFSTSLTLGDSSIPVVAASSTALTPSTTPANARAVVLPSPRPPTGGAGTKLDEWEQQWDSPVYPVNAYTPELARRGLLILQGTVDRVTQDTQGSPKWVHIYFKESPNATVTACSPSPNLFYRFGDNFAGLIGRTLEVAGAIDSLCTPNGGVRLVETNQFRLRSNLADVP